VLILLNAAVAIAGGASAHAGVLGVGHDRQSFSFTARVLPSCAAELALAGCAASSGLSPYDDVDTVNGVRTYTYYDANHPGGTIGSTVRTGDLQYQPRHVALATGEFE
jgi:3-oxoacyl-(acyl-carrier-protein) synthase